AEEGSSSDGDGERAAAPDSGAQPSAQAPATALDVPLDAASRFEITVQLLNVGTKARRSLHVVAAGEPPTIPSVTEVWPASNFMEREAFDMFGMVFEGHPELKRILMPDEWEGHPLRKDYGVGKVPVEFVPQPFLQVDAPGQAPDAGEAGTELDHLGQVKGVQPRKIVEGNER
ncbi:MAG: NADH-quinone oxidoreductase subunit C, partial [Actinomycetota bacterium]